MSAVPIRPLLAGLVAVFAVAATVPRAAAQKLPLSDLAELVDPKQAERILREADGEVLWLPRVTTLSPAAAKVLARHDTDIAFASLRRIDAETAAAWNGFTRVLELPGMGEIDAGTVAALAGCKATITLENLATLGDVTLATKLAGQSNMLSFQRLTGVGVPVADAFAGGGCGLRLPWLTRLDHPGLARKLLNAGAIPCVFEGLTELDAAAAKALCSTPCDIYFKALQRLPPDVASALEGHRGVLDVGRLANAEFAVLGSLLRNDGPLDLGGCERLGGGEPVPPEVLEAIAAFPHALTLGGLPRVPREVAAAIRRRTHHTVLPLVEMITPDLAAGLSDRGGVKGVVWLPVADSVEEAEGAGGPIQTLLEIKAQPGPPGPMGSPAVILSNGLRSRLPASYVSAIEKHPGLHFNNQFGP